MRFLLPVGGVVDHRFGILTSYKHKGVPVGIVQGMDWAGDNNCFRHGFKPDLFFPWLDSVKPYLKTCLFIACPDAVSDAIATLDLYRQWAFQIKKRGFPLAFVAQDGQEDLDFPLVFDALFIGGSTEWKESEAAIECINRAQRLGKHIHIGRVNWYRRYQLFRQVRGSDDFTCDGTRQRYEGIEKTVEAWASYMERPYQRRLEICTLDVGNKEAIQ